MAATVMTVEFGTICHYFSQEENSETCFADLWTYIKIIQHYSKLWHFDLEFPCLEQKHEYKLASSPLDACLTKNWWFLHF